MGTVVALLLPLAAFSINLAPVVERVIDRHGLRVALLLGAGGLVIATFALLPLARSTAPVVVIVCASAIGVAYGVVLISITQSLATASPGQRA